MAQNNMSENVTWLCNALNEQFDDPEEKKIYDQHKICKQKFKDYVNLHPELSEDNWIYLTFEDLKTPDILPTVINTEPQINGYIDQIKYVRVSKAERYYNNFMKQVEEMQSARVQKGPG